MPLRIHTYNILRKCAGHQEVFNRKPEAAAAVSEDVLRRIRKALALGLHAAGSPAEKEHAMRRATKLMQQYGLSQAGARIVFQWHHL
jgi:hypothetical protein